MIITYEKYQEMSATEKLTFQWYWVNHFREEARAIASTLNGLTELVTLYRQRTGGDCNGYDTVTTHYAKCKMLEHLDKMLGEWR